MKLTGSVSEFPSFTAVIVNINICREMKSPSCCKIIQAAQAGPQVHRCCVLYAICIPNCWRSLARAVMNNIICWIRSAPGQEGRRGQMVTEIVSPHLVTRLPVRSQPGICVSLYWCCSSQLSPYFSLTTSGLPLCLQSTPVNRPPVPSSVPARHSFLLLRGRDTHSHRSTIKLVGIP